MIDLTRWVNPKTKKEVPLCSTVVPRKEFQPPLLTRISMGVELELLVRDHSMNPAGMRAQDIFRDGATDLGSKVSVEALADIVETKTSPRCSVSDLVGDLAHTVATVHRYFEQKIGGPYALLPVSLEPLGIVGTPAFNHDFIREVSINKHGVGICRLDGIASTQFNIAVEEGNALLFVAKAFRGLVPLLVALTANSPFHDGLDTHMLAMRANIRGLLLDSGGWMAENIVEEDWRTYFERRARMCQMGVVMSAPWAHNGPLRLRPDREFCLEIAPCEVIPSIGTIGAMADFLRRIVWRLLAECYAGGAPVPTFFGACDDLAVQKNMQEAVIRGRNGKFLDRDLNVVPTRQALEQLVEWAGDTGGDPNWEWRTTAMALADIINHGTPAERMKSLFRALHNNCADKVNGCVFCKHVIAEVCNSVVWRRYSLCSSAKHP